MHIHTLKRWHHEHDFSVLNKKGEKRTQYVLILTAITMVVEIFAGNFYGSMALLADGWHMATHVAAFMITLFAYRYARKYADTGLYTFGTGKVNVLGGFASAIALAVVALMMMLESVERFFDPQTIHFNESIAVAALGLFINILSAWLLKDDHHHSHDHSHNHSHSEAHHHHHDHEEEHHQDHNLKAAYMHVMADAMTSVLAIVALIFGKYLGWDWCDPMMGIVGAIIITRWSYGLLKQTSPILLDGSIDSSYQQQIINCLEGEADNRVTDLHIWKVGANDYAAMISLVTHYPESAGYYKSKLKSFDKLSHVTVEVNICRSKPKPCIEKA